LQLANLSAAQLLPCRRRLQQLSLNFTKLLLGVLLLGQASVFVTTGLPAHRRRLLPWLLLQQQLLVLRHLQLVV
jgi:hypothetical protein